MTDREDPDDRPVRISEKVWRRGWRRDAIATQAASAQLAGFIRLLEEYGLADSATSFRQAAMQYGACCAVANVQSAIRQWRAKLKRPA
jgi:hypothetical protein